MIAIKVSDKILELKPGTGIEFELNNPLFTDDTLSPGSFTMPFDIAGADSSPANAAIFLNPDVIENLVSFFKQPAHIFFDGIDYKTGTIRPKTITPQSISANFIFGLSALSQNIKTARVRDLISETIVIDDAPIYKKIFLKPGGAATTPYMLIVNGRPYEGNTLTDLATAINADTTAPRATATVVSSGATFLGMTAPWIELKPTSGDYDPFSPLSVRPGEDNGIASLGFKWFVHGFDTTDYDTGFESFLNGYLTGSYPTDKIRFPFGFNGYTSPVFLSFPAANFVNGINGFGFLKNDPSYGYGFNIPFLVKNINSLQPFLRLRYVLDKIAEQLGFEWEGDWYDDPETLSMLIDNACPLDYPMDYIGTEKFSFWRRSFDLKELAPDILVVEMLAALQNRYNLAIYVNDSTGKVKLQKREAVARSAAYEDITRHCSPIAPIDDISKTGVKFTTTVDKDDAFAVTDDLVVGDEVEKEIKTDLSPVAREFSPVDVDHVPVTLVTGPFVSRVISDKFRFRIFYHKGQTSAGVPLPHTFYTDFNYERASMNAESYQERFEDSFTLPGLYSTFWKRWTQYDLNRKQVNLSIAYPFAKLLEFEWDGKRRFDRNNYLIKKLKFTMQPHGITACKAELYTML